MANKVEIAFEAKKSTKLATDEIKKEISGLSETAAQLGTKMSASFDRATASLNSANKEAQNTGRSERELKKLGATAASTSGHILGLGGNISALAGKVLILELAARQVARLVDTLFIDFNAQLETAGLGIASSYMTAGTYIDRATGKALSGSEALRAAQTDSAAMVEKLQVANFQTLATLDQLIRAYQETLPVAMNKGFNRDQVEQFTTAMVQAAGAIGINLDMLGEETRSILTGAINPRTSRVATVLGLTNADVSAFQGNADALFNFLMEKLAAYRVAGIESQESWNGVWSNSADLFKQLSAMVGEPIFEGIKRDLQDVANQIVSIDADTGKIKWNEDFMATADDLSETMEDVYDLFSSLARLTATMGFPALDAVLQSTEPLSYLLEQIERLTTAVDDKMGDGAFINTFLATNQLTQWGALLDRIEKLQSETPRYPMPQPGSRTLVDEQGTVTQKSDANYQQRPVDQDPEEVKKASDAAKKRAEALRRYELELTAMQGDEIATRLAQVDAWVEQQRALLEKAGLSAAEIDQRMADTYAAAEQKKTAITTEAAEKRAAALAEFE
ncbi:hypothetical protein IR030_16660, partial [Desulfuromonas acetoxidans]